MTVLLDAAHVREVTLLLSRFRQERGVLDPRAVLSSLRLLQAIDRDADAVIRGSARAAERAAWLLGPTARGERGVGSATKRASKGATHQPLGVAGALVHAGRLAVVTAAATRAGGPDLTTALERLLPVVAVADALRQFAAAGAEITDLRSWWRSIRDVTAGLGPIELTARYEDLRALVHDVADVARQVDWLGLRGPRVLTLAREGTRLEVTLDSPPKAALEIVLAEIGSEPRVLPHATAKGRMVHAELPADAHVGDVGVDSKSARAAVHASLVELAERVDRLGHPCLVEQPLPDEPLRGPLAPRALLARPLLDARPVFLEARLSPTRFDPGQRLSLVYRTVGAERVTRDGEALPLSGRLRVTAPPTGVAPFRVHLEAEKGEHATHADLEARPRARLESVVAFRTAAGLRATATVALPPGSQLRWLGDGQPLVGRVETEGDAHTLFVEGSPNIARIEVVVDKDASVEDRRGAPIADVPDQARLRVVLISAIHVENARVHRVARSAALARTERLAAERGVALEWLEHPYADDPAVMLPDFLGSDVDPAVRQGLARLALLAVRTVGWEDALYVLVIPSPRPTKKALALATKPTAAPSSIFATRLCCAAEHLVVATVDALPRILDLPRTPLPDVSPCVRIVGQMNTDGDLTVEASRLETRRARRGPKSELLQAVVLDQNGESRSVASVDVLDAGVAPRFVALVPADRTVEQVRIQRAPTEGLLRRAILTWTDAAFRQMPGALPAGVGEVQRFDDDLVVARPPGAPSLEASLEDGPSPHLALSVHHTRGLRTTVNVEVSKGDAFAEVMSGIEGQRCEGACEDEGDSECLVRVPLVKSRWRFDGRIRVSATDGWNTTAPIEFALAPSKTHVVIRQVDETHFLADVGDDDPNEVRWTTSKIDHQGAVVEVKNVKPEMLRVELGGVTDHLPIPPRAQRLRGLP